MLQAYAQVLKKAMVLSCVCAFLSHWAPEKLVFTLYDVKETRKDSVFGVETAGQIIYESEGIV